MNRREREGRAAAVLRECRAALAARGGTMIDEAIGEAGDAAAKIDDWRHYPAGEVYDPATHIQYFFHRHPGPLRRAGAAQREHGHFHLFLRGEGMPRGIAPLLLPEVAVANAPPPRQSAPLKRSSRDEVCHLAAVAVDGRGEPIRLFTTNRWVTGETWYRAEDVIAMLDRFRIASEHPSRLLNRWLEAVVCLFQPEIAALLRQRDQTIVEWRWRRRSDALEDPRLEITSTIEIDLDGRLARAAAADETATSATGAIAARRLPRMAEGWGA